MIISIAWDRPLLFTMRMQEAYQKDSKTMQQSVDYKRIWSAERNRIQMCAKCICSFMGCIVVALMLPVIRKPSGQSGWFHVHLERQQVARGNMQSADIIWAMPCCRFARSIRRATQRFWPEISRKENTTVTVSGVTAMVLYPQAALDCCSRSPKVYSSDQQEWLRDTQHIWGISSGVGVAVMMVTMVTVLVTVLVMVVYSSLVWCGVQWSGVLSFRFFSFLFFSFILCSLV